MISEKFIEKCFNIVKRIPLGYSYIVFYHKNSAYHAVEKMLREI